MKKFALVSSATVASAFAMAQGIGPGNDPYLSFADSPWASTTFQYFHLEDMEDGLLNTPGVTPSNGTSIIGPGGLTDSVDGDDGVIDGSGTNGRSLFFGNGPAGISFTFDANVLGTLPTHAGIVWTDGLGTITFEAFDALGDSLGTLTGNHADGSTVGTTAEDRFYGWVNEGGISRIHIKNSIGGIEVDHLQYGAVPEPTTITLLTLGALAALKRKKSK